MGTEKLFTALKALAMSQKEPVSNGSWTSWCTYEGIEYPQEVEDAIQSVNEDSSSEN